jgi:hypothetical protein
MTTAPVLRFIIAGQLRRNYLLTPQDKALLDVPGGSLLYAAAGLSIWEAGVGLIARVGENYPQEWLSQVEARGFDVRGIRILSEEVDHRYFAAYPDPETCSTDNPVSHFARLGMPFPKALLGYIPPHPALDSRLRPNLLTIRQNDFPADYLDATAAHLCPMDYLSHILLPSILRQGQINTITIDPGDNYMNPVFWDDMPVLLNGLTAFLCSQQKLEGLFQGRTVDPWEMAEALANFGCEIIVIKRGSQGQYVYNHASRTRWIIPAYPVQMVDPTGADDAFGGGFLAGYRASYDPLYAAVTGSISASMVLEGTHPFYALDSLPGLAKARLEALRDRVRKV